MQPLPDCDLWCHLCAAVGSDFSSVWALYRMVGRGVGGHWYCRRSAGLHWLPWDEIGLDHTGYDRSIEPCASCDHAVHDAV